MMQTNKKTAEVAAVLGAYIFFLLIGVYGGQSVMSVEIIKPADQLQSHSSPVELAARVTIRGRPISNTTATFTIYSGTTGMTDINALTDVEGIARLVLPLPSGNYTWCVTPLTEGHPTIRSRLSSFSINLSLLVDTLTPSPSILAVSPVTFKVRVTYMNHHLVSSANVTYYLDSKMIGWSLTGENGIAELSSTVSPGRHLWLASASKDSEGGVSNLTSFLVAQASSLAAGDSVSSRPDLYLSQSNDTGQCRGGNNSGGARFMSATSMLEAVTRVPAGMKASTRTSLRCK